MYKNTVPLRCEHIANAFLDVFLGGQEVRLGWVGTEPNQVWVLRATGLNKEHIPYIEAGSKPGDCVIARVHLK